jgi:hypothetical protein
VDRNDSNHDRAHSGGVASEQATNPHAARPLNLRPSPHIRLPKRGVWGDRRRERTDDTPREHTVEYLLRHHRSVLHNAAVDAEQAS